MLDRIRQVEEKVENGVVTVAVQGSGVPGTDGSAAGSIPKSRPQMPKAIPEDIKQIVSRWPAIVGNAENPMRIYLKGANLSLGGDNKLLMVLEDGMASDYFLQHPEHKTELETLLSEFAGKEIEIGIQTVRGVQEFEENYADISKLIQMDIEEEDPE